GEAARVFRGWAATGGKESALPTPGRAPRGGGGGAARHATSRSSSPARPVERLDQAVGVRDESIVLVRERAAPPGNGVVVRDEIRAPGVDLTPKIGQLGVEATDLRVHGLEPSAGVVQARL